MPKFVLFLRNLPWVGKVQALGIFVLLILSLLLGFAGFRILHMTRHIRLQLEAQVNIHNLTEKLQKTMLREHLGLLEHAMRYDDTRFPLRHNLRHRAFQETAELLSNANDPTLRSLVTPLGREVGNYFQTLEHAPNSGDITELTKDLRHIERFGDHILAADDLLMEQERVRFANSLTWERHITLWAGGALTMMLLVALWYGLSVMRPISVLLQGIGRIKKGDFDFQIPVRRHDDMGRLTDSFNSMIRAVNVQQRQLIRENVTDSLTGVYNTKQFWKSLQAAADEAHKTGAVFSLLMIDIDHFRLFNERHGRDFGNAVLKMAVAIIQQNLRASDILVRYGGDEFFAILPGANLEEGQALAKRINAGVRSTYLPSQKAGALSELTLSIGGATFSHADKSLEALICRADDALYAAKQSGRACVRWTNALALAS